MRSQWLWMAVICSGLWGCSSKSEPPAAAGTQAPVAKPEPEPSPAPEGYVQVPLELLQRLALTEESHATGPA